MFARLGDFVEIGGVGLIEGRGQSAGFVAKRQPAGGRKGNIIEGARSTGAEEVDGVGLVEVAKLVPVRVDVQVQMGPVIEAAAADGFFG